MIDTIYGSDSLYDLVQYCFVIGCRYCFGPTVIVLNGSFCQETHFPNRCPLPIALQSQTQIAAKTKCLRLKNVFEGNY